MHRIQALLAATAESRGRLVLVGGEAGIGKTALVRYLIDRATAHNATVVIGHCYDLSATPPYGPWRDALTRLPPHEGLPSLLATLAGNDGAHVGDHAAVFRRAHDVLAGIAATRPVTVVLEDLHWADPASLDMLRYLARELSALPLLLVATYRADELTRRHPLAHLLPALVRESSTERIDLRRLDVGAIRALVASRYTLAADVEDRLVTHLQRAAEGVPFYAEEVLRDLEEECVLRPGEPHWAVGDLDAVRVPPLLQQVVEVRLTRLGETVRDQLAVAAVIGQQVPLNVWQAASGLTEDELLLTIERAVEARLLDAADDGTQVRFAHALVREALYEGILPPRRRVWHRRVAEALAVMPAADPDAVAYHLAQAGDARAAGWLVRAGERSQRAYAWLSASNRFAAAVALMEGDDARIGERGWLLYRVGRLLQNAGTNKGIAYLEEAERIALAIDDPVLAAYALFDKGEMTCFLLEADRGLIAMEAGVRAIEALPADHADANPAVASWVAATLAPIESTPHRSAAGDPPRTLTSRRGELANWLSIVGRYAEARTVAEQYITEAATIARPDALTLSGLGAAQYALGAVEAAMGRPTEARLAYGRARAAYTSIGHHFMAAIVAVTELRFAILPYFPDDIAARQSLLARYAEEWTRAAGSLSAVMKLPGAVLGLLDLEGAWTEAERYARTVVNSDEAIPRTPVYYASLVLAALARWRGETEEAWALVRAGLPNGPATAPGGHRIWHAVALQRLAAELALDAGDLPAAAAWTDAHDRWLAWSESVRGRSESMLLRARYHLIAGDPERAREAADQALTEATAPRQPLALLAAHRLLGEVETSAGRSEPAEAHLAEALALADACAAPFERALTLLAQAELRINTGKTGDAARLTAEVRAVAANLGAVPTLARADALASRLAAMPDAGDRGTRLSAREVEVLRLVAAGRSNPEIAEVLYLSHRTVTTHLTHIYAKLAVEGRAEAVAVALGQGLL